MAAEYGLYQFDLSLSCRLLFYRYNPAGLSYWTCHSLKGRNKFTGQIVNGFELQMSRVVFTDDQVQSALFFLSDFNLISSSKNNPKVLLNIVNYVASPSTPNLPIFWNCDCSNSLNYFIDKVVNVRANISASSSPLTSCFLLSCVLWWCPVSFDGLVRTNETLFEPSRCPNNLPIFKGS